MLHWGLGTLTMSLISPPEYFFFLILSWCHESFFFFPFPYWPLNDLRCKDRWSHGENMCSAGPQYATTHSCGDTIAGCSPVTLAGVAIQVYICRWGRRVTWPTYQNHLSPTNKQDLDYYTDHLCLAVHTYRQTNKHLGHFLTTLLSLIYTEHWQNI